MSSKELSITVATIADLSELNSLINASFLTEESDPNNTTGQVWTTMAARINGPRITPERLQKDMSAVGATMLKCTGRGDEGILGCCLVEMKGDVIWSGMLSVGPNAQGKGIGNLLTIAADELGKRAGCKLHKIEVVSGRDSLFAWYERKGFKRNGVQHPIPPKEDRDWSPKIDFVLEEMEKVL